jgi:hypothetical protein
MTNINFIPGPAGWGAETLANNPSWRYRLTEMDKKELDSALRYLKSREVSSYHFDKQNFPLPTLGKKLEDISNILENGVGIFLLRGMPVREYPESDIKLMYAGLGAHLGFPVSQDLHGEQIHEVKDEGKKLHDKTGRGTATSDPLPFHTDRCDVVGLLCLYQAVSGGESRVVSAVAIHNEIQRRRPDLLECLYQPYYHIRAAWETTQENSYYPLPIFTMQDGHFATRYLRHYINEAQKNSEVPKMSEKQIEALNLVEEIANDPKFCAHMDFEPGDIQFLNNFLSLHSRGGYVDHEDPSQKRRLLRLWLSVPNSRPLNPAFAPLYYKTGAGEIRGGLYHLTNN